MELGKDAAEHLVQPVISCAVGYLTCFSRVRHRTARCRVIGVLSHTGSAQTPVPTQCRWEWIARSPAPWGGVVRGAATALGAAAYGGRARDGLHAVDGAAHERAAGAGACVGTGNSDPEERETWQR